MYSEVPKKIAQHFPNGDGKIVYVGVVMDQEIFQT